jgi:hypothetical protein
VSVSLRMSERGASSSSSSSSSPAESAATPSSSSLAAHAPHHRHDVSEHSLAGTGETPPQSEFSWLSPSILSALTVVGAIAILSMLYKAFMAV